MATRTKKKKTTTKSLTALQQAQAEMDVKYKPQIDATQGLLGEAADQYKSDIQTAKNNATATQAYAKAQEAPTIERFKTALAQTGQNEANTASALEGVGPAADIFRRAITGTQGAARTALTGAGTRATQDLSDRQLAAQAGGIAAQGQARTDYRKTKGALTQQIKSLIGQQAADTMSRFGQIAEADAERQKDIDIANIGARARKYTADVGATGRQNAADTKKKAAEDKRLGGVRKATGDLKTSVADIADLWQGYASRVQYRPNPDKKTAAKFPYLNPDGNPVSLKEHAAAKRMTPQEIKDAIQKDTDYDPGLVHIALLVRAKKPLDQAAVKYIKANPDWRIPREWLMNTMDRNIASNNAAGPPRPLG